MIHGKIIIFLSFGVVFFTQLLIPNKISLKKRNLPVFYQDSIYAIFQYRSQSGFSGSTINLKKNNTFSFSSGTDVEQEFSSGIWKKIKDSFVLTSFLRKDDLPVTVKEIIDNSKDSLTIDWVKNLNGDIQKDATVIFNGDTANHCMPVFDECKFAKGSIKMIKFNFVNGTSTRWYVLKNTSAARIEVVLNINLALNNYIFLDQKKFLLKLNHLYQLNEVHKKKNVREGSNFTIEKSFFYTRIK